MDWLAVTLPDALFVAGGSNISDMPFERFSGVLPLNILVVREPEVALRRILDRVAPGEPHKRGSIAERFGDVPNLILLEGGKVTEDDARDDRRTAPFDKLNHCDPRHPV